MRRTLLVAVSASALLIQAAGAGAQGVAPPPAAPAASVSSVGGAAGAFGAAGQVAVSADFHASLTRSSSDSSYTIALMPAADYFIAPHVSLGGRVGFSWTSARNDRTSREGIIGLRVGYDIPISGLVSLWPKVGITYRRWTVSDPGQSESGNRVTFDLFAPFLFHLAPHFFIGVGPFFNMDLVNNFAGRGRDNDTRFGIESTVGGWFNL